MLFCAYVIKPPISTFLFLHLLFIFSRLFVYVLLVRLEPLLFGLDVFAYNKANNCLRREEYRAMHTGRVKY